MANERAVRAMSIVIGILLVVALTAARVLPPAVVVLSVPFLYMLTFKPVFRRLALGHIARRPRETALVVLGSMLGTAIITGSFVVGDTLDASLTRSIYTQLGPIDAIVTSPADLTAAERAISELPPDDVDGVLPATLSVVTAQSTGGKVSYAEPEATLVEVDFDRARAFGDDPEATGIEGTTPADGETAIGEDLAVTLRAGEGDTIRIYAYGGQRELRVVRVLDQRGVAGITAGDSSGSASPTLFVRPGLIEEMAAANPTRGEPPTRSLFVSAAGGVTAVADDSAAFKDALETAGRKAGVEVSVVPVKFNLRDAAKELGDSFTQLFFFIGLFSVFAGVLLLVNIFVMLAQERQSELGMLRAVGLRRLGLVGSFSLEGWMYATASSVLGTIAGLGVGRVIVIVAAGLFAGGGPAGQGGLDLVYAPTRASVAAGMLLGFVFSIITVAITSVRISFLNVIRAIRDLPEPAVKRRGVLAIVLDVIGGLVLAIGALMTLGSIANDRASGVLLFPALVALGAVRLVSRVAPRRALVSAASGGLLLWEIGAFALFPRAFRDAAIAVFVIQGVLLVGSAIALLSQNQQLVVALVRRVGGGNRNMSLRLGLAYPLARGFRTAMTLAMYALVVYMLATITIFSHLFSSQVERFTASVSGGFDLVLESNSSNPIAVDDLRARPGVADVAPIASAHGEYTPLEGATVGRNRSTEPVGWPAASFDESFIAHRAPALEARPALYATDADAYRAVLASPDLFIPTAFFLEQGGGPPSPPHIGEKFLLRDPLSGRSRTLTVAAVAQSGFGSLRPLMADAALRSVFGERAVPNVFYVGVPDGADADDVAAQLNATYIANGANAESFGSIIESNLSQQQGFFRLMRGYLALGLVIGIAGLGVVMVRAVRERRREVGVLRALGFEPSAVRRAFIVESGFVALEGILTGTVLSIITTCRLTGNADFGATLEYTVPWLALVVLVVGTIVASLLATAAPAQQAARIHPAVALRIAD